MSQHGLPTPPSTPRSRHIVTLEGNRFSQDGDPASEEANRQQSVLHYLTDACFSTFDSPHFHAGDFILDLCPGEGAYTEHMQERGFVLLENKYEWSAHQGLNIDPDFEPPKLIRCGGKPWILHSDFLEETYRALAHGGHFLMEFIDLAPPSGASSAWQRYEDLCEDYVSQVPRLARSGNVKNMYTMIQAAGFVNVRVQQEILKETHDAFRLESVYWSVLHAYLRREECYLGEETVEDYCADYHEKTNKLLDDMRTELNSTQLNL